MVNRRRGPKQEPVDQGRQPPLPFDVKRSLSEDENRKDTVSFGSVPTAAGPLGAPAQSQGADSDSGLTGDATGPPPDAQQPPMVGPGQEKPCILRTVLPSGSQDAGQLSKVQFGVPVSQLLEIFQILKPRVRHAEPRKEPAGPRGDRDSGEPGAPN